jgi:malate dehydrogenase (oxaloacetate-decarboxylating)
VPPEILVTKLTGKQLLADPYLNKGSAFPEDERDVFGLRGLTPIHTSTLEQQLARTYENFLSQTTPLDKYIFLAALQDRNEILFYHLIQEHITEMAPIIYTPTVGEACQRYSHIFRRARGLYLSSADAQKLPQILRDAAPEKVEVIVVTDGERILGLGDLGVGGMGIPIGKLCLYTLCAGIDPRKTLPVLLDVGTNNKELLNDSLYLGWRHPRLEREEYDQFIDLFVRAVHERWPQAILQWEDFSKNNAWRLLRRHQNQLATFNDDIQGTAAVTLAGLLRASKAQGIALKDQRVVIAGAGSAATGVASLLIKARRGEGLSQIEACDSIWLVDTKGLVHVGRTELSEEKMPFAKTDERLRSIGLDPKTDLSLEAVVKAVKPTALLGTSGQAGMFHEDLVRSMAAFVEQPIIFPLSNPTSKSEAHPEDLIRWTAGRALISTGSPFSPIEWKGSRIPIGQCNNAFIFPGVGLGLTTAGATLVPEDVFLVAAKTLAAFDQRLPAFESSLFPNLEHVRDVSYRIAVEVAREIVKQKLTSLPLTEKEIPERVKQAMWEPIYPKLKKASA